MYKVITRSDCAYCTLACELLKTKGLEFSITSIEKDRWVLDLFKKAGIKTVPQIWCDGEHIGGYTELKENLDES